MQLRRPTGLQGTPSMPARSLLFPDDFSLRFVCFMFRKLDLWITQVLSKLWHAGGICSKSEGKRMFNAIRVCFWMENLLLWHLLKWVFLGIPDELGSCVVCNIDTWNFKSENESASYWILWLCNVVHCHRLHCGFSLHYRFLFLGWLTVDVSKLESCTFGQL